MQQRKLRPAAGSGRQLGAVGLALLAGGGLLTGCFWGDDPHDEMHLAKDFYLSWTFDERDRTLLLSTDGTGYSGSVVVGHTVVAAAYDNRFILLRQHPDKQEEVGHRLFDHVDPVTQDFVLSDPADTVYLWSGDSVYRRAGRWHHTSNGWNPPDSLKPYFRQTFYHIVDIRRYDVRNPASYRVYTFTSQDDFRRKRTALGVSPRLTLTPLPDAVR